MKVYKSVKDMFKEEKKWEKEHLVLAKLQKIYYVIYRFFIKIGDFFLYDIKAFVQRGRRGYADRDVWGFDYYLSTVISKGIDKLIKDVHGYPCDLKNIEEWESILRKIRKVFKLALIDTRNFTKKEEKEYDEGWKLFKKYFNNLWD